MTVKKCLYVWNGIILLYVRKWTYCIHVQPQNCTTKIQTVMKMECPYLSVAPNGKICRLMVGQGLDGDLDDFDITHYCKGNPNHCYFYRSCSGQKTADKQREESAPRKIQVAFYDELSKLKLGEAKISVARDESHPLYLELIKRGFRYRVKPELEDKRVVTATKEK